MPRLLVVDDEAVVAADLEAALRELGHDVCGVVASAEEACAVARDERPDLVIMDVHLAGEVDGVEAGREIRASYGIPVVYITANSDRGTVARAGQTEAFGFVVKPWSETELRTTVEIALAKSRFEIERAERDRWFAATLATIRDAVVGADGDDRITFVNAAAEALLGRGRNDLVGRRLHDVFSLDPKDGLGPISLTDAERRTGALSAADARVFEIDMARVAGERGSPAAGKVVTLRDVTERWRDDERRRMVGDATGLLALALDLRTMATAIAALVAGRAGCACQISTLEGDACVELAIATDASGVSPSSPRGSSDLAAVLRARVSALPSGARLLELDGAESYVVVPILLDVAVVGRLAVVRRGTPFDEADVRAFSDLAWRAGLAFENARLYAMALETNRLKDEFLAAVSHELRTPLMAILGWCEMARLAPEEGVTALAVIERNGRTLSSMIEDVLDLSRVTSGKLRFEARRVDLGQVLRQSVEDLRPTAEEKRITLSAPLVGLTHCTSGDPCRLRQVIANLLTNALKFTPAGGHVSVSLREEGEFVELTVTDDGEGIPAAFLPHVFEAFRQEDGSASRRHGGLGLGLALVDRIVKLHGGMTRAESAGKGLGATFTIALPKTDAVGDTSQRAAASDPGAFARRLAGISVKLVGDEGDVAPLAMLLRLAGAKVTCGATPPDQTFDIALAFGGAGDTPEPSDRPPRLMVIPDGPFDAGRVLEAIEERLAS